MMNYIINIYFKSYNFIVYHYNDLSCKITKISKIKTLNNNYFLYYRYLIILLLNKIISFVDIKPSIMEITLSKRKYIYNNISIIDVIKYKNYENKLVIPVIINMYLQKNDNKLEIYNIIQQYLCSEKLSINNENITLFNIFKFNNISCDYDILVIKHVKNRTIKTNEYDINNIIYCDIFDIFQKIE